jgi:hypothetical protein
MDMARSVLFTNTQMEEQHAERVKEIRIGHLHIVRCISKSLTYILLQHRCLSCFGFEKKVNFFMAQNNRA